MRKILVILLAFLLFSCSSTEGFTLTSASSSVPEEVNNEEIIVSNEEDVNDSASTIDLVVEDENVSFPTAESESESESVYIPSDTSADESETVVVEEESIDISEQSTAEVRPREVVEEIISEIVPQSVVEESESVPDEGGEDDPITVPDIEVPEVSDSGVSVSPSVAPSMLDNELSDNVYYIMIEIIVIVLIFSLSSVIRNRFQRPVPTAIAVVLTALFILIPITVSMIICGWSNILLLYIALFPSVFVLKSKEKRL